MSDISHLHPGPRWEPSMVLLDSGNQNAPETGKHYLLNRGTVLIGSSEECEIQLPSQVVMPKHARVENRGGEWWLLNLTHDNSVLVQHIPTSACCLDIDGLVFQVGQSVFKFLLGQGYESACFAELYRRDVTDFLTNVYNKRHFSDLFLKEMVRAHRYQRSLALMLIDLDEFGKVNKSLGQLAGDAVLKEAAKRMQESIRGHDLLGRIGGEEFAVLLPETDLAQAKDVAERVRLRLYEEPCTAEGKPVKMSLSAGLSVLAGTVDTMEEMMRRANRGMHLAKQMGRNQVCVVDGGGNT